MADYDLTPEQEERVQRLSEQIAEFTIDSISPGSDTITKPDIALCLIALGRVRNSLGEISQALVK